MTKRYIPFILAAPSLIAIATAATAQPTQPGASATPDATAQAQEANETAEASTEGPDIVITARRRAESLQDVPQTVNAVTGNTLAQLNIQKFEDIQVVVPGLNMSSGNTGYSTAATIRGAAFNVESGASPTVEFYLNEAHIESVFLFQSMFDIGQVEVLRGPQGTLRGKSSPSGSITATTRRPDLNEIGGFVNMTATHEGGINVNAALNVPIIDDVLGLRVAGTVDRNDHDEVRSINNMQSPFTQTWGTRVSLRFEPTNFISANLMWQHLDRDQRAFNPVESISLVDPAFPTVQPIIRAEDRLGITDGANNNHLRQDVVTANVDVRLAGQKLSYVGGWSDLTIKQTNDADNGNFFAPQVVAARNNGRPYYGQIQTSRSTEWTHELRLSSEDRLFDLLDYTVGAFLYRLHPPTDLINQSALVNNTPLTLPIGGGVFALPGFNVVNTPITRDGHRKEKSIFGNLNFHFGEATELSIGARHIWFKDDGLLVVSGATLDSRSSKVQDTVYNVSLSHKFSDDFMVYANTGSSFRAGPFFVGVFRAPTPRLTQFTDLPDEKAKSYEIGFKSTFLDRRARLNVALFRQNFKNYIYRGVPVWFVDISQGQERPAQFALGAGVDAKVTGVDIDAAFQVTPEWNINAAFSYAKSKMKGGVIPCTDLNGDGIPDTNPAPPTVDQIEANLPVGEAVAQCTVNDPISLAPKWSLTLQSEYARPVSSAVDGFVRGLFSYYPKNRQDPYNAYDNVGSYGLLNLYAGIRSHNGAWEVSLFGKNILNVFEVLNRGSSVQSTTYTQLGFVPIPNPPFVTVGSSSQTFASSYLGVRTTPVREFGINLRYAFGSR